MTARVDAIIVGGGPAGATAGLLLARAGWSVVVVEKQAFPRRKVCGEYLSATSLPLLDLLGIGVAFRDSAGPPVRRVGLFAGGSCLEAELPRHRGEYGRALSRERLDALLLDEAARAGAVVRQPCGVTAIDVRGDTVRCRLDEGEGDLRSSILIAAHGSWYAGTLPTQPPRYPPSPSDLLGFKAHFAEARLPEGLMPLLAFAGGYGGMVHTDGGRVSLSCCIRRDQLNAARQHYGGDAGDAVFAQVMASCRGIREALGEAKRDGDWLGAGPIRPGIRLRERGPIFLVGNAAGEAHPVVAEGISMAMQSSWLLAERLIAARRNGAPLATVGRDYAEAWRRAFAPRLFASRVIAEWAMRPFAVAGMMPLFRGWPSLLNVAARWSGKATRVVKPIVTTTP